MNTVYLVHFPTYASESFPTDLISLILTGNTLKESYLKSLCRNVA